jgi:cytochrome bd ubiquinol oxidase subunit II
MGTIWFCLVAIMIAGYVVLDGFDIGVGILHLYLARSDDERRVLIRSIGPVWDGNEVWLIAAGGTLYFAFPVLYAASFSGFYLPLMMVLWLLILRGVAIEFRSHVGSHIWSVFWDAVFSLASILLAVFFGAALGNVARGVPLDASGNFFEPLWTNFQPAGQTGILDWYTILIGVASLVTLALHGAAWLTWRTTDELRDRAHATASLLWWIVAALTVVVTFTSFHLLPVGLLSFRVHPFGFILPMLAIAGLLGVKLYLRTEQEALAFAASCIYIVGMLTSVTFTLYPNVLPATTGRNNNLTIFNAKAADYGLKIGLIWWLIGMSLAVTYTIVTYTKFAGKIRPTDLDDHASY